jgi:hypothetical protein
MDAGMVPALERRRQIMSAQPIVSRFRRSLVAGALGLVLPLSGLALDRATSVRVKVFPDHYIVGGERFSDLEALEARVKPVGVRALRLDSCGLASTMRLLAAVERFHAYVEGLEIRALGVGEPGCSWPAAERESWVRDSVSRLPRGSEYYATDKHGRAVMP